MTRKLSKEICWYEAIILAALFAAGATLGKLVL